MADACFRSAHTESNPDVLQEDLAGRRVHGAVRRRRPCRRRRRRRCRGAADQPPFSPSPIYRRRAVARWRQRGRAAARTGGQHRAGGDAGGRRAGASAGGYPRHGHRRHPLGQQPAPGVLGRATRSARSTARSWPARACMPSTSTAASASTWSRTTGMAARAPTRCRRTRSFSAPVHDDSVERCVCRIATMCRNEDFEGYVLFRLNTETRQHGPGRHAGRHAQRADRRRRRAAHATRLQGRHDARSTTTIRRRAPGASWRSLRSTAPAEFEPVLITASGQLYVLSQQRPQHARPVSL